MSFNYVICTDSYSDLTREELLRYGIYPQIIEGHITYDGEGITDDVDTFYDKIESKVYHPKKLKTASPSIGSAANVLKEIISNTSPDTIIFYAGVSQYISGTWQVVDIAIDDCFYDYPDREIINIHTGSVSNGLALFLQFFAKQLVHPAENSSTKEEFVHKALLIAERLRRSIHHASTQREFDFLRAGGRITTLQSATLTALKFSPWLHLPSDDTPGPTSKIKNRGNTVLVEWAKYYQKIALDIQNNPVRIGYAGETEYIRAQILAELISVATSFRTLRINKVIDKTDLRRAEYKVKYRSRHGGDGLIRDNIQIARIGTAVGTHVGSTALSFFFLSSLDHPRAKTKLQSYPEPL